MVGASSGGAHRAVVGGQPVGGPLAVPDRAAGQVGLAGDLFLTMLDDASGVLRVQPRLAGFGLAGAVLVEVCAVGNLTVARGQLVVCAHPPPEEPLRQQVFGRVLAEPAPLGVGDWVAGLAVDVVAGVVDRLAAAQWVRPRVGRRLTGRQVRWVPVDREAVFWRAGRLAAQLARGPCDYDLVLVGLLDALGFAEVLLRECPYPITARQLAWAARQVAARYPAVAALIGQVRALTERAALTR